MPQVYSDGYEELRCETLAARAQAIVWVSLLEWVSEDPVPAELDLQVTTPDIPFAADAIWPGTNTTLDLYAGNSIELVGSGITATASLFGLVRLTFDSTGRVIYADLRNGRYAIGSHQRVRVDVGLWGVPGYVDPSTIVQVRARVAGTIGDADYLRCSVPFLMAENIGDSGWSRKDIIDLVIPPGAQFFDLQCSTQLLGSGYYTASPPGVVIEPAIVVDGSLIAQVAYAPPIRYPLQTPIPINRNASALLTIRDLTSIPEAVSALLADDVEAVAWVLVTFYVR